MRRSQLYISALVLVLVSDLLLVEYCNNLLWLLLKDAVVLGFIYWGTRKVGDTRIRLLHETMDSVIEKNRLDLTVRFEDEPAELKPVTNEISRLFERTEGIVTETMGSAARLIPMSQELADTYNDSTQKAYLQTNYANSMMGAMESIAQQSNEVARRAEEIAHDAEMGHSSVNSCMESMAQTNQTVADLSEKMHEAEAVMEELNVETGKITSIVEAINSIAEQTNLLALNAAIEAARAGEQGRGFAVVADEVRALAARTRESTDQVQAMLEDVLGCTSQMHGLVECIGQSSRDSSTRVGEATTQLVELVDIIGHVNTSTAAISQSAQAQLSSAEEARISVQGLGDLTNKSLEHSKQHAVSKDDLERLAEQLKQNLEQFKISSNPWYTERRSEPRLMEAAQQNNSDGELEAELF